MHTLLARDGGRRTRGPAAVDRSGGLTIGFGIALWETTPMQEVPESKLSRVILLDYVDSTGPTPAGYAPTALPA